ncbi:ABC transporter substrate-binding protein [Paracoccus sp. PS-1]|uniref:ABC transporter substrate-binding protein n=1 Tax=unclassified Paracoccus (in: a-proteobacteria) TaxID=2688777 RepID=UPI00048C9ECE|nr:MULTISPECIES: ABC transporter substrate-binding protein [unclassified Paracoccus (in: a-proteobacteria)]MDQ7261359.1 ABC transporter substrate-binding protein [Paracoccus sp. PS1]
MTEVNTVRVIAFPGAPNLPVFAAIENGDFAALGLDVALSLTGSSIEQAERTARDEFDIVFTAFDNVVAYNEGQGAAAPGLDPGYVAIAGATRLDLAVVTARDIDGFAQLAGRKVALDAPTTGFAFAFYDMCAANGIGRDAYSVEAVGAAPQRWEALKFGACDATLLIEPFTSIAERAGFHVLKRSTEAYAHYQGGVIAARRGFLKARPDLVERFLRGYLAGLRWVRAPENRQAAEALLARRMPQIQPAAIATVMNSLLSPETGLTPDARFLDEGAKQVLALRNAHGGAAPVGDYARYVDLSRLDAVLTEETVE